MKSVFSFFLLFMVANHVLAQELTLRSIEGPPQVRLSWVETEIQTGLIQRFGAELPRENLITGSFLLKMQRAQNADQYVSMYSFTNYEHSLDNSSSFSRLNARGRHGFDSRIRLTEENGDGLVLALNGNLEHAGTQRFLHPQINIGGSPYVDGALSGGIWILRTLDFMDEVQITIPILYTYRGIDFDEAYFSPIGSQEIQQIHSGFGIRPKNHDPNLGWYEIMGFTYSSIYSNRGHLGDECLINEQTSSCFNDNDIELIEEERYREANSRLNLPTRMTEVESVSLDALHVDRLEVLNSDGVRMLTDFSVGGRWMWDQLQNRSYATFSSRAGILLQPTAHMGNVGFHFKNGPVLSPDARSFAQALTLEGVVEWSDWEETIGFTFRAGVDWFFPELGDFDTENAELMSIDSPARVALRTGWFTQLVPGFQLNINHSATNVPDADGSDWMMIEHRDIWQHRFTATLRWHPLRTLVQEDLVQNRMLSCSRAGCRTLYQPSNNEDVSVPWDPCHGEAFSYEASFDLEDGFDYVMVGSDRLTGHSSSTTGTQNGATTVTLHTDGSIRSNGLTSLTAECGLTLTAAPPPPTGVALLCEGTHCATTLQELPHNLNTTATWDPCNGTSFTWQAHVSTEMSFDYLMVGNERIEGDDVRRNGQSQGPVNLELHTDGSVTSQGIHRLEATCIVTNLPLICENFTCETESPLPHNIDTTLLWDPCGGPFGYWGVVSFEPNFDFLQIGSTRWDGYETPIEGFEQTGVQIQVHTNEATSSEGIIQLQASCSPQ